MYSFQKAALYSTEKRSSKLPHTEWVMIPRGNIKQGFQICKFYLRVRELDPGHFNTDKPVHIYNTI